MADIKKIADNKKARFNYSIEDSIECGIVLEGTEVKSVKSGKNVKKGRETLAPLRKDYMTRRAPI